MPRQERLVALALAFEGLQFGGHVDGAVAVVTDIEGNDADGVAGYEKLVAFLIVEHEGKDAAEVFKEVDALLAIQSQDDLAVAAGLEVVLPGKASPDVLMVIDFAIDGQNLFLVGRVEGLPTRFGVDDAEPLVGKNGASATIDATPVGPAVANFLTHLQGFVAEGLRLLFHI